MGRRVWQPGSGRDWKSEATVLGRPLIHIAYGRDLDGRLRVARGFIAIGQFAVGYFTLAQFGIGWICGVGQVMFGAVAVGQLSLGLLLGVGQLATGYMAVGQLALGTYAICQAGLADYMISPRGSDPEAVQFFKEVLTEFGLR
jgi:hypothetical protein